MDGQPTVPQGSRRRLPRSVGAGYSDGMKGYTAEAVRSAEAPLLAAGLPLMQRAAAGLAEELRALDAQRLVLLVGTGDNGGDALFAGAELAAEGADVAIVLAGDRAHPRALEAALVSGARLEPADRVRALADAADVIVDGLVGTGSRGALRGGAATLVEAVAGCATPVVAVDIPSGIDPDTGEIPGAVLPATVTVTFGACKAGLLRGPAVAVAGRVRLVDIGLDLSGVEPVVETTD